MFFSNPIACQYLIQCWCYQCFPNPIEWIELPEQILRCIPLNGRWLIVVTRIKSYRQLEKNVASNNPVQEELVLSSLIISIGLVRNATAEGLRWLARWNARGGFFDLIISDRLEGEPFRESVTREVAWQLNLDRHRDFVVANMAQANLEFIDRLPGDGSETAVAAAFYNIEIYRPQALDVINADPDNAWLTSQEICEGVTHDNRPLSPLVSELVRRSQVIQHWESSSF